MHELSHGGTGGREALDIRVFFFLINKSYVNGNLDDSGDGEASDEGKAISLFVVVLITLVTLATVIVIVIVIDGDHIPILIIMIKKGDDC